MRVQKTLHVMIFLGGEIISEKVLILRGLISSTVFCMQLMNLAVNELHLEGIKTQVERSQLGAMKLTWRHHRGHVALLGNYHFAVSPDSGVKYLLVVFLSTWRKQPDIYLTRDLCMYNIGSQMQYNLEVNP